MKLLCETCVQSRSSYSPLNRRQKSTLAIGLHTLSSSSNGKENTEPFILLFNSSNKSGTRYKLKQNIENIFTKFMTDGKATISFKEPLHDIQIQCDPTQLKCFLKILKLTLDGNYDKKKIGLTSVSTTAIPQSQHPITKMTITRRGEYPIKGLPRTLKTLQIMGIKYCKIDSQIFLLNNLQILNLKDNCIKKIPKEFGRLQLQQVDFTNNQLGSYEQINNWEWLVGEPLKNSLRSLKLSSNKLTNFPYYLVRLGKLITLRIDYNNIESIPFAIRRMKSLKFFYIAHNKLQTLPSTLFHMHFDTIDIAANQFGHYCEEIDNQTSLSQPQSPGISLLDLAANKIINQKIFYTSQMIPMTLINTLEESPLCQYCNRLCSIMWNRQPLIKQLILSRPITENLHASMITVDSSIVVMQRIIFCSNLCATQLMRAGDSKQQRH